MSIKLVEILKKQMKKEEILNNQSQKGTKYKQITQYKNGNQYPQNQIKTHISFTTKQDN